MNQIHADKDGQFSAIVRYEGYDVARNKIGSERASLQSDLICVGNETMMMASASVDETKVHMPNVLMLPLNTPSARGAPLNLTGCLEDAFTDCASDGKFSMISRDRRWWLYMHSDLCRIGGCRFLQVAQQEEWGRTWSAFTLRNLDSFARSGSSPSVNSTEIYFFDVTVEPLSDRMRARFPAVIGTRGGIYEIRSENGLLWSEPREVWAITAFEGNRKLHPVGMEYLMHINLFHK